jgi:hypothetical protein
MHKNAMKYNKTLSKWCKNKHGASKIIDTLGTYHQPLSSLTLTKPRMQDNIDRESITCSQANVNII